MRVSTCWLAGLALLASGCAGVERTPGGLGYVLGFDLDSPPPDLEDQLDAAWRRVGRVLDTGQCVPFDVPARAQLHKRLTVVVRGGLIHHGSGLYYGLTWSDQYTSEVALYKSRLPGATHELWHLVLKADGWVDGDAAHQGPCWGSVGGDAGD